MTKSHKRGMSFSKAPCLPSLEDSYMIGGFLRRNAMTYLTIPDELDKRFSALAAKAQVPKDEYALQALEEDQEDYLLALEISQRIERGEEKTIPYEEVLRQYENEHTSH